MEVKQIYLGGSKFIGVQKQSVYYGKARTPFGVRHENICYKLEPKSSFKEQDILQNTGILAELGEVVIYTF